MTQRRILTTNVDHCVINIEKDKKIWFLVSGKPRTWTKNHEKAKLFASIHTASDYIDKYFTRSEEQQLNPQIIRVQVGI